MNPKEFLDLTDDTFARMKSLTATKGVEYKGGATDDQFANFKRYAQRARVTVGQAWSVLFGKHLDAIDTFIRDDAMGIGRKRSEPIEGRIDDAILYLLLLKGMVRAQDVGYIPDPGVVDQREPDHDNPSEFRAKTPFPPLRGPIEFSIDYNPHGNAVLEIEFPGSAGGMPHTIDAIESGVPAALTRLGALVGEHTSARLDRIGQPTALYVMSDDEAVARGMCRYLGLITSAAIASPAFIPRNPTGAVIVYVVVGTDRDKPQEAFADKVGPNKCRIPAQFREAMDAAVSKGHAFVGVALSKVGGASTGYAVVSTMAKVGS